MYFAHFEEVAEIQEANKNSKPDREVMEQMKEHFETGIESLLAKDQKKLYKSYLKDQCCINNSFTCSIPRHKIICYC